MPIIWYIYMYIYIIYILHIFRALDRDVKAETGKTYYNMESLYNMVSIFRAMSDE